MVASIGPAELPGDRRISVWLRLLRTLDDESNLPLSLIRPARARARQLLGVFTAFCRQRPFVETTCREQVRAGVPEQFLPDQDEIGAMP